MDRHRVSVLTLAREDIRALPRNGFGLGAVLAILTAMAVLAMGIYDGESGTIALFFFWVIAQLVVAIVLAARVAAARRSRFVDSLYTTPLDQPTWLAAQVVVGVVLAGFILVVQVPFLLLQIALVGLPAGVGAHLAAAVVMAAFAVALGLFCGVVVGEAGPGAAASVAGGFGFLSFVLFIFNGVAVSMPPTPMQELLLRATALSPLTLAINATGINPFEIAPAHAWRPVVGLAAMIGGISAAAWLAYTRFQGPLGWEPRRGRALVAACVGVAFLVPVATAEVAYTEVEDDEGDPYDTGEHTQVAFVPRGTPLNDQAFTFESFWENNDLLVRETVALDVLVLLLAPEDSRVSRVTVQVEGSETLDIVGGGRLDTTAAPEGTARPGEGWDEVSDGPAKPVYRIPVDVRAPYVKTLLGAPAFVNVTTTFVADGRAYTSEASMMFQVDVPAARTMLLAAGMPFPLLTLAVLVHRNRSTR